MTDYVVFGTLVAERAAEIVRGVARGCELAGLRAARGRDRRAPRPPRPGRLRPGGRRDRRRGGGRPAGAGPGAAGGRGTRAGVLGAARQRLLTGPAGDRRGGPGPGRRTAGTGPDAGRGTADPDHDLRAGLPGPGRPVRRARLRPRHRGRAGRQPGPGAPAGDGRHRGPRDLAPGRRSSGCSRGMAGSPKRNWSRCSTWASAWSPWWQRTTPTAPCACSWIAAIPAWRAGEVTSGCRGASACARRLSARRNLVRSLRRLLRRSRRSRCSGRRSSEDTWSLFSCTLSSPTPSSVRSRSRSVPPLLYLSWRATFTCLALARPRPIGSTPSNMRSPA